MKRLYANIIGLCFFLMSLVALNSYADEAYCLSKKYPRFLYIVMSGGCLEYDLADGVMVKGRNIGLEEYDLYSRCLIKLGLAPKAALLSKKEQSDLNECLKDAGSSLVKTTADSSGAADNR